jgi:C1A family cysteine protease
MPIPTHPPCTIARHYGWRPDLPDVRDLRMAPRSSAKVLLAPRYLDLPKTMPAVWDQGDLGSCTAHAILALVVAAQVRLGLTVEMLSRLFLYYAERVLEGTTAQDAGAQIRSGMKALAKVGVPPEALWPYVVAAFATRPSRAAFKAALHHQALRYQRVPRTLPALKGALVARGPVAFGFTVRESFESDLLTRTGFLPIPARSEAVLGGHAVAIVGYDDTVQGANWKAPGAFLVRGSYGPECGIHDPAHPEQLGHFWFSYGQMTRRGVTSDFWALDMIEGTRAPSATPAP